MTARSKKWMVIGGLLLLAAIVYLRGCGVTYSLRAANYGHHGVVLLGAPVTGGLMGEGPFPNIRLGPGIPTVRDDMLVLGRFASFAGVSDRIPLGDVEIVWQLAELGQCGSIHQVASEKSVKMIESAGYPHPRKYTRKEQCTWTPIEGAIFRETIDTGAIRTSDAYKQALNPLQMLHWGEYTVDLLLVFEEEDMRLEIYSGRTNPWR